MRGRFIRVGLLVGGLLFAGGILTAREPIDHDATQGVLQQGIAADATETLQRYEFQEKQMGVPCDLVLYAPSEEVANGVSKLVYERISALNRLFSDYEPESELMRLSRISGRGQKFPVSPEMLEILEEAQGLSEESGGTFDVTVGPLVKLWRKSRRVRELPPVEELAAARKSVGYQFVEIDHEGRTTTLVKPGMQLDLGGIAKGYAAQVAIDLLKEKGIRQALCAMAGDIVVSEPPPGKAGWRIGIAPLEDGDGEPERFVLLKNLAISTSGDSQQFVVIDGVRYSHILDPRTGLGLTTSSSVTVITPRGSTADGLGKTLSVLPPEEGLKLIEKRKGCAAFIVRKEGTEEREFVSRGFEGYWDP